jgi:hypothetical protein
MMFYNVVLGLVSSLYGFIYMCSPNCLQQHHVPLLCAEVVVVTSTFCIQVPNMCVDVERLICIK